MLCSRIDWKRNIQDEETISPSIIDNLFKNIFQSPLTMKDPNNICEYEKFIEITCSEISIKQVGLAVEKKRKCYSFDSIAADIFSIAPPTLLEVVMKLTNAIFNCAYPDSWKT